MPFVKIITTINWVLIGLYGAWVLYAFIVQNKHSEMNMEGLFIGLCFFILLLLVGLNLMPYWVTKIAVLFIVGLLLWWYYSR